MKLSYADLPKEVKSIANSSLGLGVLRAILSGTHTYHLILKVTDGVCVGFSIYHFEKRQGRTVGVFDCVCVAPPYRKEGFGRLLTLTTLRKMSSTGVDRVELPLKVPSGHDIETPGVPLLGSDSVLKNLGFIQEGSIQNAYTKESKRYGYDCLICGSSPDKCQQVLYSIDSE